MKKSSILITALFAGIGGVIAGTLFAPGKGSRTRNKITRKGQKYKDYLLEGFDGMIDTVSHPFESLEKGAKQLNKKARSKAKKLTAEVNQQ